MCKAFSCLVTRGNKVYWKAGVDSHEDIINLFVGQDCNLRDDKTPPFNTFARIEIIPPNYNYLSTNFKTWKFRVDELIKPDFLTVEHEDLCFSAFEEWAEQVYTFNVEKARNPIHPFKIVPPATITEEHLALVKKWASVRNSVEDSVEDSVGASIWDSVRASIWGSVGASIWDSVRASIWDSVGASIWDSVRASIWDSVWGSVRAYAGSLFPLDEWKYADYTNPLFEKGKYPFQPVVDLWKLGLVPSFDGTLWRLHGGLYGKVLWEGKL